MICAKSTVKEPQQILWPSIDVEEKEKEKNVLKDYYKRSSILLMPL
jgi:hypothetical protein